MTEGPRLSRFDARRQAGMMPDGYPPPAPGPAPAPRSRPRTTDEIIRDRNAVGLGLGRIVALYHLLILFTPESRTYSVPLFLKRQ
jgi:hypothetical protein